MTTPSDPEPARREIRAVIICGAWMLGSFAAVAALVERLSPKGKQRGRV